MAETTGADELAALRAEAEAAGVKIDGRWGADRLRSEIESAQPSPAGAGETDPPESMDLAGEPAPDVVYRAGGWVDRGDGRGWELEE